MRVTADAAYDTVAVYETAGARGATVVVPPARTANVSGHGPRSPARDRTITLVKTLGRRQWKKASGYHRQSRVENTFFRYKSIIGDGLRARSPAGQGSEVVLGCENPQSDDRSSADQCHIASASEDPVGGHRAGQSRFVQQRHPEPPPLPKHHQLLPHRIGEPAQVVAKLGRRYAGGGGDGAAISHQDALRRGASCRGFEGRAVSPSPDPNVDTLGRLAPDI